LPGSSPITFTSPSSKAHQKSGPFPQPALPGFDGHTTSSDSRHGRRLRDVEAATLTLDGSPPITRTTFPTCRAHYPGGSNGCACRLLPRSYSLPQMAGGSASALSLSRPAQTSLTLRPAGLLNRLKRPLSRGSGPAGYPAEPLVSYQINRQLSGWNLPPLVIRAFGAHCQGLTYAMLQPLPCIRAGKVLPAYGAWVSSRSDTVCLSETAPARRRITGKAIGQKHGKIA
jgi:hypothetical protein